MRGRLIEEALHVPRPNDDLSLSEQALWGIGGDPVKFLRVFFDISQHPQRWSLAWDLEMLDWMISMWKAATDACPHADDVKHELRRYRHLRKRLDHEMCEGNPSNHIFLNEVDDWPNPRTILRAMFGLLHAQQRTLN